jgi:hypothetical protein
MMISPGGTEKLERQRRDRSRRVLLLIVGVVLLSLGDLLITIAYLTSTGMMEANPVAEFIITATGSVWALAAYKTLTVAICVGLLYRLRRLVEGEVAAWCAVMILALMSLQWYHYARQIDNLTAIELAQRSGLSSQGGHWLILD